jgi:CRISPR-associated protein (TIGR03984 family)
MSLAEAVAALSDGARDAIALVYSARRCCFARVQDAALVDGSGSPIGSDVFEARIFNEDFELRWVQSGFDGGVRRGPGVILHETEELGGEALPGITGTLPRQYLLWGQGDPTAPGLSEGWSILSTARIGTFAVPLANVASSRRVIVRAREYVAQEPDHGNAYIAEERLLGLSIYSDEAPHA